MRLHVGVAPADPAEHGAGILPVAAVGVVIGLDAIRHPALAQLGELHVFGRVVEIEHGIAIIAFHVVDAIDVAHREIGVVEEGFKREVVRIRQVGVPHHGVVRPFRMRRVALFLHFVEHFLPIVEGVVFHALHIDAQLLRHGGIVDERDEVAIVLEGGNAIDVAIDAHGFPDFLIEQGVGIRPDGGEQIVQRIVRAALRLGHVVQLGL